MAIERRFSGRKVIYTDYPVITSENLIEVLQDTLSLHEQNRRDIDYLYEYYKGNQPILDRIKSVRPEICNRIVENRANEIVSFKVGYLMGEPVQYVNRNEDNKSEEIELLNNYVFSEDKASKDKELADWFTICGTSYRAVFPDDKQEEDEAPFEIFTLDPRNTFVVRWSGFGNAPVMAVNYVKMRSGVYLYNIYTPTKFFEVSSSPSLSIVNESEHTLGGIPIIEYPANSSRIGAFEVVLPLLDAINTTVSNRIDGVEQFVQSYMMFKGVDIDDDDFAKVKELGAIKVPTDGDVKFIVQELNQGQTQVLIDDMYQTVLTICGMPNRNGGTSTSDTGSAVIMRDGWSAAEARAKDTELMFKRSEKEFLRILLNIVDTLRNKSLKLSDIDIRFTRRNYENIQEKANVLIAMLNNDKIHPRLAFSHSGMFVDSENAYLMSKRYYDEESARQSKELDTLVAEEDDETDIGVVNEEMSD